MRLLKCVAGLDMRCEQKPRDPRWEQIESSSVWKEASAAKPISYEADRKRTSAAGTGEGPKRARDHREIPKSFQNQVCEVIA